MSRAAKATIGIMAATIIAKILGFFRELILASIYGASMYSDAYILASNIPWVILTVIGTALSTTFIPIYFDINNNKGKKLALKFTNNTINIMVIICIIITGIAIVFPIPIVKIFAYGFNEETFTITVDFTRILILGVVFTALSHIMTAYLQIKNNFIIPSIIGVPKNIIIITSMLLSIKYGPYIMVWGTLLGMASEFLFQLPFAIKNGYKYESYINIKDEYVKKTVWLMVPVLIGVGVNQINAMIDRGLASTLVEGSISALNYANKLNGFIMALFITSVAAVIYPMLSKLSLENNKENFSKAVAKSVNSIILLVLPISIGAIVLSTPIVKFLFQRGAFDAKATNMTSIALVMYSIGMVAFGLRDILGKVFYSRQDTKTPMTNGIIAMIINIVLNIILVKPFGYGGLAFATSMSAIICILLLFGSLKKKIGYFGQDKIIKTTFKSIISAIVMGIITYFAYNLLNNVLGSGFINEAISLFVAIGTGSIVYGVCIIVLKVEEVSLITDMVKKKLKI